MRSDSFVYQGRWRHAKNEFLERENRKLIDNSGRYQALRARGCQLGFVTETMSKASKYLPQQASLSVSVKWTISEKAIQTQGRHKGGRNRAANEGISKLEHLHF
ncbi:hypothetical protein WA026_006269 [Henosepilachna vigintioctopunctata]|uniref:Transposase n=1 Tax=Henosepilachna vigintioctopunctata TaxID=420089 RepID=A0AAW1TQX3_9CUCU